MVRVMALEERVETVILQLDNDDVEAILWPISKHCGAFRKI